MKILFVGDIVGKPGRAAFRGMLPALRERYGPDVVIVNGENAAGGYGLTPDISDEIFSAGADVITTGNHIWDKRDIYDYIDVTGALIRPANFPEGNPGKGVFKFTTEGGTTVAVVNLVGRVFMHDADCPFRAADKLLSELKDDVEIIVVDMHGEATSEKIALGWYLDGRVSAVVGSHTHVQTADDTVLAGGTAFISDMGMTGSTLGVLGMRRELVLERFLTQRPVRFEVAKGAVELQGVFITIDPASGKAMAIERVKEKFEG